MKQRMTDPIEEEIQSVDKMDEEELKKLLDTPHQVVIFSHRNPDGDALGSSLAMASFLQKWGHSTQIVLPSEYPAIFEWMDGVQEVLVYDQDAKASLAAIEKADLFFCLDFNALDRIDKSGEAMKASGKPIVLIDHHIDPENFANYLLSDTTASSTCELVYDFIHLMGKEAFLDVEIGTFLYTGIVTDTGSFKYSTTSKLFRTVAELIDLGVDDYQLQDLIFNSLPEKNLRILGHCLANRMEILEDYQTGIITLNRKDFDRFQIQRGDTEGVVNFILKMKKVKVAAFITEQPNIVKLSLRSKGDFSVQQIAARHFNGGGHRNAAGGYSYKGLRSTVRRFKSVLPEYAEQLRKE